MLMPSPDQSQDIASAVSGLAPSLNLWQRTLRGAASCSGIGVHSGKKVTMKLLPAEPNSGIIFVRVDLKNGARATKATWDNVIDTKLCTVIGNTHGGSVATIEHLMAAIRAAGIDNAVIEIDGPEVPVMDGSSDPFVFLLEMAGIAEQDAPRREITILKPVEVKVDGRWARLVPDDAARFSFSINFDKTFIRKQTYDFTLTASGFKSEISRARTFGFFEEVDQLRKMGLALGGSLQNSIVIKDDAVMNEDGLRYSNEFVRHKLLDAIGDMALSGAPIRGHFQGNCSGHAMNNRLLRAVFADPSAWTLGA
ncbi:MAG: UDP-3-O-acyl-N-acetylglucosamine deacetylase [Alphaproteobacteria bacterium]|nr:UDP-3-O-acyl-N-acetylglucosamine deacetylase [Alphaproteobacteria bacterium]